MASKSRRNLLGAPYGRWWPGKQYEIQGGRCFWCGAQITFMQAHVDHLIPRSKGGEDEPNNYAIACAPCNMAKGNKMPWEFVAMLRRQEVTDEFIDLE